MEEVLLESNGDGGFARGRETSEPNGAALLLTEIAALVAGQASVPGDVAMKSVSLFTSVDFLLAGSWRG